MKIKQILVPLTGETKALHVVDLAFQIARESGAHVIGTDTVSDPGPFLDQTGAGMTAGYYSEVYKTIEKAQAEKRKHAFAAFDASRKTNGIALADKPGSAIGVTAEWLPGEGYNGNAVSAVGRLCDLIVINLPGEKSTLADRQLFEMAAFNTRRPVLLVPPGCTELGSRAAIAWNGSAEACAAVEGALPLLTGLDGVDIIQVGRLKPGKLEAVMLQNYLGWHRIATRVVEVPDAGGSTAKIIHDQAKASQATFLVMGAYTHSPLRELILGGVTQSLSATSELPLVMAH
ncbi:MAG: universal stress protein [Rhodospirillaceae bacterium]|nr:universal stress protein [Rhodospirillaceae bacterium]